MCEEQDTQMNVAIQVLRNIAHNIYLVKDSWGKLTISLMIKLKAHCKQYRLCLDVSNEIEALGVLNLQERLSQKCCQVVFGLL